MSHKVNDEWLGVAITNCREAIENRQWDLAEAIVEDIRNNGFMSADALLNEVKHAKTIWKSSL